MRTRVMSPAFPVGPSPRPGFHPAHPRTQPRPADHTRSGPCNLQARPRRSSQAAGGAGRAPARRLSGLGSQPQEAIREREGHQKHAHDTVGVEKSNIDVVQIRGAYERMLRDDERRDARESDAVDPTESEADS